MAPGGNFSFQADLKNLLPKVVQGLTPMKRPLPQKLEFERVTTLELLPTMHVGQLNVIYSMSLLRLQTAQTALIANQPTSLTGAKTDRPFEIAQARVVSSPKPEKMRNRKKLQGEAKTSASSCGHLWTFLTSFPKGLDLSNEIQTPERLNPAMPDKIQRCLNRAGHLRHRILDGVTPGLMSSEPRPEKVAAGVDDEGARDGPGINFKRTGPLRDKAGHPRGSENPSGQ
ncbi:hypothetical protein B0H13DRAFT_1896995 [Mycena leptocephala]|nr:hypothetical protein B0H13DRAFT_1896995 [Mycena leptocephala]